MGWGKHWDIRPRGKHSTTYLARVRVKGSKAICRTFDTREEAEAWAERTAARLVLKDPTLTTGDEYFREWITRYIDEEADKFVTARDKKRRLSQVLETRVAGIRVRMLTPSDFEKLRDELAGRGLHPQSVRHYLQDCSAVWTAASVKWQVTSLSNPLHRIKMPPVSAGRRNRIRVDLRERLQEELGKSPNPFYPLFAEFLFETGLRVTEPLRLREADIDRPGRVAYLKVKGSAERPVPMSVRALQLVDAALAIRQDGRKLAWGHYDIDKYPAELVWPISYRGFKNAWDQARNAVGAPEARPHDLRRERALSLLERGVSVPEVQLVTGHRTAKVLTEHYLPIESGEVAKRHLNKVERAVSRVSFAERVRAAAAARRSRRAV